MDTKSMMRKRLGLTELGNARRFYRQYGDRVHYDHNKGKWLYWDGSRWRVDNRGKVVELAKKVVRSMYADAIELEQPVERSFMYEFATRCESLSRIKAMVELSKSERDIPAQATDFNPDPLLFNVLNGTVDLRTGLLRRHSKDDMISQISSIEYNPNALCPRWIKFISEVMLGDNSLVDYIQRVVGYSLTALTTEQCLFFLHGGGANGKSTFIETLRVLLGEYATQSDPTTLMLKVFDGVRNDIARLVGSRLVCTTELPGKRSFDESVIKQMTGGDSMSARFLYQEAFEFQPTWKIILSANQKPRIHGVDFAIWRRIKLVPFELTLGEQERDINLLRALKDEVSGILNWAVEGCIEWQRYGLTTPQKIIDATKEYQDDMDTIGPFIDDRCIVGAGRMVGISELYEYYIHWCNENKEQEVSKLDFGRVLKERHPEIKQHRTSKKRVWRGIEIRNVVQLKPIGY